MAHNVRFTMPARELGKTDVVFEVWKDDEKFGTLKVSKGSLVWFPRDTSKGRKIGWTQFDNVMATYRQVEWR